MKQVLIITFDLIRDFEPKIPYSIGSILSYLYKQAEYEKDYSIEYYSFNLLKNQNLSSEQLAETINQKYNLNKLDFIALGTYI